MRRHGAALLSVTGLVLAAAVYGGGAAPPAAAAAQAGLTVRCTTSKPAYAALAARMAGNIAARLAGRVSRVGLEARDSRTGITCQYHASWHFYSASAIKATILSALLRKAQEEHRQLTPTERGLAWLMITQSDNNAATALWNDVGIPGIQHFLDLAGMRQTRLSGAWGLSLITAHDEVRLLHLLTARNRVLYKAARIYARYLMAHVIPGQRWGVPAGAPRWVTVHVKNGWLPFGPGGWEINSIGTFTTRRRVYSMAILTYDNPSMSYGIATIEGAAVVIHRDLHPGIRAVVPRSVPAPSWGTSDGSAMAARSGERR